LVKTFSLPVSTSSVLPDPSANITSKYSLTGIYAQRTDTPTEMHSDA
jgi:hypothetical protein